MAKILIVDIETAPTIAYVWQAWKANVGINQIKQNGYIMSFAAKWLGKDKVHYVENRHGNDKILVTKLFKLFDEADIVVAHNGKKFDIPTVIGRGLIHGLNPPAPFKQVDTLTVAKNHFRFFRNNLEYIAQALDCAPKLKHGKFPGFELWLQCLKQNDEAWAEMKEYNVQDVLTLEEVYLKMRPFIANHPNVAVFDEVVKEEPVCPKCGDKHIHFRGYATTNAAQYHRFQCKGCGGWGRLRINQLGKDARKALAANVM